MWILLLFAFQLLGEPYISCPSPPPPTLIRIDLLNLKIHVEHFFMHFIFSPDARIRALAASFARKDTRLVHKFLEDKEKFGLVEVLKAITLLDSSRQIRVHEKKLKRLQMAGKVKKTKVGKIKSDINNLNKIKPKVSVSVSVCGGARFNV